jgi:hypothetical protein
VDLILLMNVKITAFWASKQSRVVLDSVAFGWSVNNAHHLIQMELDQLVTVSTALLHR